MIDVLLIHTQNSEIGNPFLTSPRFIAMKQKNLMHPGNSDEQFHGQGHT